VETDEERLLLEMGLNTNSGSPLLGGGSSSTTSTTGSSVTSACGAGGGVGSSGSGIVCGGGESEDGDEDIWDLKQQFHNTVRENIVRGLQADIIS